MPSAIEGIFYFYSMETTSEKYPIGPFEKPATITEAHKKEAIQVLASFPQELKSLTHLLQDEVLDSPYRKGSWTIRQLIHHISDSHTHSYNRVRWTLSEEKPVIKAYDQEAYAKAKDYTVLPISWSIKHLEVIHQKLVFIYENLTDEQWKRSFIHPETHEEINLEALVLLYAWHSKHHFAHIKNALETA